MSGGVAGAGAGGCLDGAVTSSASSCAELKGWRGEKGPSLDLCSKEAEMLDPTPDVRQLFIEYDALFFGGKLASVEVKWSKRMTLCAGVCSFEGGLGLCSIRLSEPLLKLRPRSDLVNTLLHEMIHAYLFLTSGGVNMDRDGHGPDFQYHAMRINDAAATRITIYHTFNDEVEAQRGHWWLCNGRCQSKKPHFGYVKRAMNRVPGPSDWWWSRHQRDCGGTFRKVKEPEGYKAKPKRGKTANTLKPSKRQVDSGVIDLTSPTRTTKIDDFFTRKPPRVDDGVSGKSAKRPRKGSREVISLLDDDEVVVC